MEKREHHFESFGSNGNFPRGKLLKNVAGKKSGEYYLDLGGKLAQPRPIQLPRDGWKQGVCPPLKTKKLLIFFFNSRKERCKFKAKCFSLLPFY